MGTIKNSSDSETVLLEILWKEDKMGIYNGRNIP